MGEFGLIKHLTQDFELKNSSSLKGIGDDAAILDYKEKQVLVTTDLLLEGVHFDLTYVRPRKQQASTVTSSPKSLLASKTA